MLGGYAAISPTRSHTSRQQRELTSAAKVPQLPASKDVSKQILAIALEQILAASEELDDNLVCLEGRATFARDQLETIHYSLLAELLSKEANMRYHEESLRSESLVEILPMASDIQSLERQVAAREEQQQALRVECGKLGEQLRLHRRRCTIEALDAQLDELNTFLDSSISNDNSNASDSSLVAKQIQERCIGHAEGKVQRRSTSPMSSHSGQQGKRVPHTNQLASALLYTGPLEKGSFSPMKNSTSPVRNGVQRKSSSTCCPPQRVTTSSKLLAPRSAAHMQGAMPCMRAKNICSNMPQTSPNVVASPLHVEIDLVGNNVTPPRVHVLSPALTQPGTQVGTGRHEEPKPSRGSAEEESCIVQ